MKYRDEIYYIGHQRDPDYPYVFLHLGAEHKNNDDYVFALSKAEVLKQLQQEPEKFLNTSLDSEGIKTSMPDQELDLGVQDKRIPIVTKNNLWDYLLILIQEDATFTIPGLDEELHFSQLTFSMKTDEVSIMDSGSNLHIIWSTPQIGAMRTCGSIKVTVTRDIYEAVFDSFEEITHTDDTVTFEFNTTYIPCIWNSNYCLMRFRSCELQVLLYSYSILHARVIGYDIGNWIKQHIQGNEVPMYSHLGGKSRLSGSTVAFKICIKAPTALELLQIIKPDVAKVATYLKDEDTIALKNFILQRLPHVFANDCLDEIIEYMLAAFNYPKDTRYLADLHSLITYYSCRIFSFKMAYLCPLIALPTALDFSTGAVGVLKE